MSDEETVPDTEETAPSEQNGDQHQLDVPETVEAPVESSEDAASAEDTKMQAGEGERRRTDDLVSDPASRNLDLVMDIPVTLSMELGRTRISIQDLLQMNSGSVVELQRMADEPMDVLVNGTLVAHGEAVVIGEKFGVRLTDVVSAKERVRRIR